ncbi:MAG: M13 family metallopeptidase [Candidatus Eisenbacteria bacterium]
MTHIRLSFLALMVLLVSARAQAAPVMGFDRADLDTTCAPCKDFYQFANGGWVGRNSIPPAQSSWGSFNILAERNLVNLRDILERAANDRSAKPGSDNRRIGDYHRACMDSLAAEAAGASPMQPMLVAIDGVRNPRDVARQIGWVHAHGLRGGFSLGAGPDAKRSDLTIANAGQGGLGLPDRDYYTKTDSASAGMRAEYLAHIERSLGLLGRKDAAIEAQQVMAIETALAKASMTNVQRRDPNATYHKVPLDTLKAWTPEFDWATYFIARGMKAPDSVNVGQPDFMRAFSALLATTSAADWQSYLRWGVVDQSASTLSEKFVQEDFRFRQKQTGAREIQPRWKRCLQAVDQDLGDLLGQVYVRERFTPQARARALKLVRNLEAALGERIVALDWMSEATKAAARVKLDAFANRIGYPDKFRTYDGVEVRRDSWTANRMHARRAEVKRRIDKIGQPVDKGEWGMTPPTVNAFYSPSFNSINFPAGILQPPFYDPEWDDALNYGAIGAVIGHEMTHGFDDQGRQFDSAGNLRDWWTAQDAAQYKERATKVAEQFEQYTVAGGLHVNGRLTLGENIADLGGLAVAFHALQKAQAGKPDPKLDGFSQAQRFFLSYARVWRRLDRDEALATMVKTNPHSPARFRVLGPLSNLDEFAAAFGCKAGDPMVREASQRVRIW